MKLQELLDPMHFYTIKQKEYVKENKPSFPHIKLISGVWFVDMSKSNLKAFGEQFVKACYYVHAKNLAEGRYRK